VKTNDTQYFYPNVENTNTMTNGADETLNQLDTNMAGLGIEPPPTPDPPIQWGPEEFIQLRT
jgi:hypothetical protein